MSTENEADRARGIREAIETRPETVDVADVIELLVRGDRPTRRTAFEVYEALVAVRSPAVHDAAVHLETHLADDSAENRRRAALTAGVLVEGHPDAFKRVVPELRSIGDATESGREPAIVALAKLAFERPNAVVPAVDTLLRICHDPVTPVTDSTDGGGISATEPNPEVALHQERQQRDQVRVYAIAALTVIAGDDPTAVRESVSGVADLLDDHNNLVRAAACEVLEAVAGEFPGEVEPFAPQLAELATSDVEHPVPWRAADALVALEAAFPERVGDAIAPVVEGLSKFLDSRTADRRRIGVTLVADAAIAEPNAIEPLVLTLRELLADDDTDVRTKAALALGFADTDDACSRLAEIADTNPNETVRDAADRALDHLERTNGDGE